jgi:zinc protease
MEEAFNEEVEKMQTELISEREFQKLRNQIEANAISGYGTMGGHRGKLGQTTKCIRETPT